MIKIGQSELTKSTIVQNYLKGEWIMSCSSSNQNGGNCCPSPQVFTENLCGNLLGPLSAMQYGVLLDLVTMFKERLRFLTLLKV